MFVMLVALCRKYGAVVIPYGDRNTKRRSKL